MRGNGQCWIEGDSLRFHRLLTNEPLTIPLAAITGVRTGTWHAGKWLAGKPIVKIDWRNAKGRQLSSGFGFANFADSERLVQELSAGPQWHGTSKAGFDE
jgi:hypothetical protein